LPDAIVTSRSAGPPEDGARADQQIVWRQRGWS